MTSPIKPPDGNWWNQPVNRRESIWLGVSTVWALIIFGWMSAFTRIGDQNPIGRTYEVSPDAYQEKVSQYKDAATETDRGLVPAGTDIYIAGLRYDWDGLPVVLEAGQEYNLHFSAYDVQHGFSIRPEETLSKQINLQIFPGHEWIIPMTFDEPGTYHVICNEFCGVGHRSMHGTLYVEG